MLKIVFNNDPKSYKSVWLTIDDFDLWCRESFEMEIKQWKGLFPLGVHSIKRHFSSNRY